METASTHAALLIANLLHVHALTNMHRASGRDEFRKSAADWLPALEQQLSALKRELQPTDALPSPEADHG